MMKLARSPFLRQRRIYALGIMLVIGTGLIWRSGLLPLSHFVAKYGGDALWALAVFLGLGCVFPRGSTARISVGAICIAWSIEFLQLYHSPWIEAVRSTRMGRLALGTSFNSPDLLAYVIGVAIGAVMELLYFAPRKRTD